MTTLTNNFRIEFINQLRINIAKSLSDVYILTQELENDWISQFHSLDEFLYVCSKTLEALELNDDFLNTNMDEIFTEDFGEHVRLLIKFLVHKKHTILNDPLGNRQCPLMQVG